MDLFSLIEGMPGTGKTKVIVGLIEILANLGLKVLVSSYTNNSLDCILDRVLSETNIGESKIIREGTRNGSYNQLYYNRETFTSADDIDSYFKSKKVWFVTLSSLQLEHVPSDFNVVIIDEASQCLEPLCISALEKAKKFVLIGDYQQLQPLVRSQEAAEKGMAVSLFERMCKKYSELKTPLKKQYRMCEEIMALSNSLVYNNLLEAADEKTKTMRLKINEETFICLSE
jgi:DNA replication ATP-dependent helicase Dna2